MEKIFSKNVLHDLFEITVFLKGISGGLEIILGMLFLVFSRQTIYHFMVSVTHHKFVRAFGHTATNYLMRQENGFSLSAKYFIATYLIFYGLMNIFLVVSLIRGKLWAYPVAITFFIIFITYQCYRYSLYHSFLLLLLTLYDVALVLLTWREYQRIKKSKENPSVPA